MPTITIPDSPIGASSDIAVDILYTADQSNKLATCRFSFIAEVIGDQIIFNGQPWTYSTNLTTPTDFKSASDFVIRFNDNADFNRDYVAVKVATAPGATEIVVIEALLPTSETNITASATGGINLDYITTGQSQYSKNDISQFSQILRLKGNTTNNEKRTSEPLYSFEISSQIRGKLKPFKIEEGTGVIFQNVGSFKDIETQIGTSFIDTGDTIKQSIYDTFITRAYYLGENFTAGLLTDRSNFKVTNLDLLEYCSFLVADYSAVTNFKRRIDVTYTDDTTQTIIDGSVQNPTNGIITAQAFFKSFNTQTDNTKTIRQWTVSLAQFDGTIVYEGQTYANRMDNCISTFQVLFTNIYGGIEIETFKTSPTLTYTTESQASRTGDDREFNFVTDDIETISIDEQNITDNQYAVLKGLLKSKWVYVNLGTGLIPVRLTASNLNNENFNANFKIDA